MNAVILEKERSEQRAALLASISQNRRHAAEWNPAMQQAILAFAGTAFDVGWSAREIATLKAEHLPPALKKCSLCDGANPLCICHAKPGTR